jgi:hypothetical protein
VEERALSLDIDVFSRRLGRLRLCAMVFDRRGVCVWELMFKWVGTSSGSSLEARVLWVLVLEGGSICMVPGTLTPVTWRASKGREIDTVLVAAMVWV